MSTEDLKEATLIDDESSPCFSRMTKNQTIVDTIKALRLPGVTFMDFITFRKARETYEREIDEKNKQPGVNIQKASYATSIDHNVLELFIARRYIVADCIKEISDDKIKNYTESRCERSHEEFELTDVDKAVKNVSIKMNIPGAP